MTCNVAPLWTIEELGTQVALALSENYAGQRNRSVRDIPDERTIRFYTTRGLIDRPTAMRGRTALYGRRHLLQLVAIKHLQAKGLTLREIQQKLLGATDRQLQDLAKLPIAGTDAAPDTDDERPRRQMFWRDVPAPAESAPDRGERTAVVRGVRLAAGVTLLFEANREPEPEDIEAVRAAAAPLVKLLEKRRLTESHPERRTS